jgi:hypothetical protein
MTMPGKKQLLILLFFLLLSQSIVAVGAELIESSASVKGNELHVKLLFSNNSSRRKEIAINVNYLGQLDRVAESIPPNSTKLFTYKISDVKPGEVRLAILADSNAFIKIIVPENMESGNILLSRGITAEEWKKSLPPEGPLAGLGLAFRHLLSSPDAIAVATVLLIAAAVLLAIRIAFRRKTPEEKRVESTERLLKEVEEIEKQRKLTGK